VVFARLAELGERDDVLCNQVRDANGAKIDMDFFPGIGSNI